MSDYKFPTLEEFVKMVSYYCRQGFPKTWDRYLRDYLQSDDAQEEIEGRYEEAKKRYDAGELPQEVLEVGVVSSVANCLYYMC